MRKAMVEADYPQLSVRQQCELLGVNRNRLEPKAKTDWHPGPEHEEMLALNPVIHAEDPTMGTRQSRKALARNGYLVKRWTIGKMMKHLGIKAIYCKPCTSKAAPDHPKYPYLLRGRKITEADEVWAIDITYILWSRGHVYLVAIIDWKTRAVLAWRVSNTMDVDFCLDVLCEAVGVAGKVPTIINTDQGSQFIGVEWLSAVESAGSASKHGRT
jgi:putative transposase